MPQFELEPLDHPAVFVRARTDAAAVAGHLGEPVAKVLLEAPEAGSGWRPVTVDGAPWGRVRPRDRMRFRRD